MNEVSVGGQAHQMGKEGRLRESSKAKDLGSALSDQQVQCINNRSCSLLPAASVPIIVQTAFITVVSLTPVLNFREILSLFNGCGNGN